MRKKFVKIASIFLLVVFAVSCAPKAEPVLKMSGLADKTWTLDELKAMPSTNTDYTNKDGETTTYSGVTFSVLFKSAGISDFSSITLVAADDYTIDVTKDELSACPACLVAIQEDGSLRSVMPGFSGKQQVKDLVEILVK